ncbi:coiled-coil domain-containing protein 150 isoform X2 [Salminus brasiliensis]|uniref:coiled-coil domain-containing protein 150 isoform X2 n=1 Tax=Salminus brasiliensis TaxID=930266 RepID=UPI003B82C699
MSRPVIRPLSIGATAPESLSVLHQRLLVAEEQAEELLRDMGTMGVSKEQLRAAGCPQSPSRGLGMRPLSPVRVHQVLGAGGEGTLWRQCEALVGRVCRLESLLHTLKLTTFRLETERELNPAHSARLQEQLAALQEQCEEEQHSSRREVMRLRDQLEQACQDREEARQEVHTLRQQLDNSHLSKVDVALAADELKVVKVQMSQKLQQMKEELEEQTAARLEAEQSHSTLLQRVEEMEGVVERESEQVKLLQADCHALRVDGQETRAELQEKEELTERLQKECEQLRDQSEGKDTLASELTSELKSVRVALQKQQHENCRLVRDGGELRAAANKVQALNDQLEAQCSDLSSALRSLTAENARLQTTLTMEQERVTEHLKQQDLLLDAAKRNIQAELQGALADRLLLQKELDSLRADHAKLQQSSAAALDTAAAHQDLLDRTIERLRGEVSSAAGVRESLQKERDEAKSEMTTSVSKLEKERTFLESQLSELQVELCEMSSALQKREEENRGLRGRLAALQHQQYSQPQVEQMLRELMDSKNKLTYEKGKLQIQVQQLGEELKILGAEHIKHQTSPTLENKYTQMAVLQEAPDTGSRKLPLSLETSLLSTQEKLHKREAELLEARAEIGRLAEEIHTLKLQLRRQKHSRTKSAQRDVTELQKALEETSARSGDLSRANRELREKVSELEKLASYQKSRIKAQKAQLKQHLDSRAALSGTRTPKDLEAEMKSLERSKTEYEKKCYEQAQALLQLRGEMAELQAELQTLSSIQQGEQQAERSLIHTLQEKCQISENLQEAHCWFRSKFDSLYSETELNPAEPEEHPESRGNANDGVPASPAADTDRMSSNRSGNGSVLVCVAEPELERWASTLQRWETKRELARIASGYKRTGRAHSIT